MLLQHCFRQQRSTQVAVVHCSAQTSPSHVLQKLGQMCMVISSNTGRVYRPKDCDRLILYLKDLNLPKPDKWGTSQLIAFLHQVINAAAFSKLLSYFVDVTVLKSYTRQSPSHDVRAHWVCLADRLSLWLVRQSGTPYLTVCIILSLVETASKHLPKAHLFTAFWYNQFITTMHYYVSWCFACLLTYQSPFPDTSFHVCEITDVCMACALHGVCLFTYFAHLQSDGRTKFT